MHFIPLRASCCKMNQIFSHNMLKFLRKTLLTVRQQSGTKKKRRGREWGATGAIERVCMCPLTEMKHLWGQRSSHPESRNWEPAASVPGRGQALKWVCFLHQFTIGYINEQALFGAVHSAGLVDYLTGNTCSLSGGFRQTRKLESSWRHDIF